MFVFFCFYIHVYIFMIIIRNVVKYISNTILTVIQLARYI